MSYLFFATTIGAARDCKIAMSNLRAAGRSKNVTDAEYDALLDLVSAMFGAD